MAPISTSGHQDQDGRSAAIAFVWILIAFKVVTMALIFVHLPTAGSFALLASTFWYWIPIIVFLVAGPVFWRYRLMRVRARREQLRRSEWMIDPEATPRDQRPIRG